jgi:hypothetical protein
MDWPNRKHRPPPCETSEESATVGLTPCSKSGEIEMAEGCFRLCTDLTWTQPGRHADYTWALCRRAPKGSPPWSNQSESPHGDQQRAYAYRKPVATSPADLATVETAKDQAIQSVPETAGKPFHPILATANHTMNEPPAKNFQPAEENQKRCANLEDPESKTRKTIAPQSALQAIFLTLTIAGALLPWTANIDFIRKYGPSFDIGQFIALANANPASRSLSLDLAVGATAIIIWMVSESRRLKIKGIGWVLLSCMGIAFACGAPLFLYLRERRLQEIASSTSDNS